MSQTVAARVLIALIALLGVALHLVATRHGVGLSPDSVMYIGGARSLAEGRGLTSPYGAVETNDPVIWYPPLYSATLAVGSIAGIDPLLSARWLQGGLLGLSIILFGYWAISAVRSAAWIAVAGAFLFLAAAPLLPIYVMAWSEPLFLLLALSGLWLLAKFLAEEKRKHLLAAGLALGLAWLSRYSGVAFVGAAVLGTVLFLDGPPLRRLKNAVVVGTLATLPMALWMIRNYVSAQTTTGRRPALHPVGEAQARELLDTVSSWLFVPMMSSGILKLAASICVMLVVVFVTVSVWRDSRPSRAGRDEPPAEVSILLKLLLLSFVVYGALLILSLSIFDANTPLDNRILSPVYVALLFMTIYTLHRLWMHKHNRVLWRGFAVLLVIILSVMNTRATVSLVVDGYEQGFGWSASRWQHSGLMDAVRELPAGWQIYSNAPDGVYIVSGRRAQGLPKKRPNFGDEELRRYYGELESIARELENGPAAIVFLTELDVRKSSVAARDLQQFVPLHVVLSYPDGDIYVAEASR